MASLLIPGDGRAQVASGAEQPRLIEAREGLLDPGGTLGEPIPIWGYDGIAHGQVLRVRKGAEVFLQLANALPRPTTIHWRGVRGPNGMDGVAGLTQAAIAPGARFEYRFAPPDAGTFFYHAHPAEDLDEQVHRGLSGVLIVDEDNPPETDGEILLALADWRTGPDGKLAEPAADAADRARSAN